jgi:2OG-Fe(II) oxygenase superfamily
MTTDNRSRYQSPVLDIEDLERGLDGLASTFSSADPYPHIVIENFLFPEVANLAMAEFPPVNRDAWNTYSHANERKFSHTDPTTWGETLQAILKELNSDRFVKFLADLTGLEMLFADDSLEGGGLHQSTAGGFLNIHADFTVHPHHRSWQRRVNLLLYLNEDWKPEYGGDLELWSTDMKRCVKKVAPIGNRALIFTTDMDSFHGHPEPMTCPPGTARQSLALYYFTREDAPTVRSTEYRSRPGDGFRSIPIYLDKQALRAYDAIKRHLGLSDATAEKFLRRVERLRRTHRD